jgi:ATP-dependent helicase HrpA
MAQQQKNAPLALASKARSSERSAPRSDGQTPNRVTDRPNVRAPMPNIVYPESLPVSGRREDIARAIAEHPVVIVCGETGSGKTTQLPKIAWQSGCGTKGLIGHTQPRRLAATSVAKRIAQELGSPPGEHVGYKIRFNETMQATATLKLMTDGILLAETLNDPHLRAYDCLIIDEAHERSLNIDFLLGYLKQLLDGPRKNTLKLIITSATIDAQRFAEHFADGDRLAPVIEVSGRLYPVEVRYNPLELNKNKPKKNQQAQKPAAPSATNNEGKTDDEPDAEDDDVEQSLPGAIAQAVDELWRSGPGDILVFLPGEREIRDCMEHLRKAQGRGGIGRLGSQAVEILPLFSRLSAADQERVFSTSNGWRIVLSTNVAETSLTVPGVRYVIDTGLARVKRYRYRSKVEQLQVEAISQAAANQRAGRCGRVADGICIRLYDEFDYLRRTKFTDPEIMRSSLAAVILRMKALRLTEVEAFPFLDRPPSRAILDGYALLTELQALDDDKALTPIGKQLARLPLDPRIARMLLAGHEFKSLPEMLVIAAALSVQDPRERPMEAQQAADQKHLRFLDERSDFVSWLKLWQYWQESRGKDGSNRTRQEQLKREFLSPRRLREWTDVHHQLQDTVKEIGWLGEPKFQSKSTKPEKPSNSIAEQLAPLTTVKSDVVTFKPVDFSKPLEAPVYERIHRALLAGLLGNLGLKSAESNVFLGTHEVKFLVHPGSGLAKKPGKWVMAAELVETTRLYARHVAQIQVDWIEKAAPHLLRRSCSDARWEKKAAQVMAFERAVLYGLPIYTQRRVPFGGINPELSRELMIRAALVDMEWESRLAFMDHNRRLVSEIQALEHRIRRQDLLIDESMLYSYFDARVPADIVTGAQLELWWRKQPNKRELFLIKDDLIRKSVDGIGSESFPGFLSMRGVDLEVQYHFEPGSAHDGVTLIVPLHLLNQIDGPRTEWLVPGMLKEKVLAFAKTLPPKQRHRLQPLDEFAQKFAADNFLAGGPEPEGRFTDALRDAVKRHTQLPVLPTDFRSENIAPHFWMRFVVQDEFGRELGSGRDLAQIRSQLGQQAQSQFKEKMQRAVDGKNAAEGIVGDISSVGAEGKSSQNEVIQSSSVNDTNRQPKSASQRAETSKRPETSNGANGDRRNLAQEFVDWSFGELTELIEATGPDGKVLYGYPALVVKNNACLLDVFDDPQVASREHRLGLAHLFALQFKEQVKLFDRHIIAFRDMTMHYMNLGNADELRAQLLSVTLNRACMADPLPINRTEFEARVLQARPKFGLIAQEVGRLIGTILTEYTTTQKKLVSAKSHTQAFTDMQSQLKNLVDKKFVTTLAWEQLTHLPRYLKAIALRVDKLKADSARDQQRMLELSGLLNNVQRAMSQRDAVMNPRLQELRWLIEELRVSLFAQELKTPVPVSVKRLEKLWQVINAG